MGQLEFPCLFATQGFCCLLLQAWLARVQKKDSISFSFPYGIPDFILVRENVLNISGKPDTFSRIFHNPFKFTWHS